MYKVIEKTIKFDRDMLVKTIMEDSRKDNNVIIEDIINDCELRPETLRIYTRIYDSVSKPVATSIYNKCISEFDFTKKIFNNDSAVIYISSVELIEIDYDGLALKFWDRISTCNEISGRRSDIL